MLAVSKKMDNTMYHKAILTLALVVAGMAASAQTVFNTVEEAWQYADTHNITIKNAAYELDKARYGRTQSYMALLPQANATGSFIDNTSLQTTLIPAVIFGGPSGVYTPVQFGQKYIYAAGFSAQVDLVNLQTWQNLRIARETEDMNKASLGNTRKNTYQQIATQYYAYVLNKEAARLAIQSQAAADSVLQSVSNKFTEGTVSQANVDIAKLNSERALQTRITAEYQMQTAKNTLKGLLNLSVNDSLDIPAQLPAITADAKDKPFAEDPALRLADYQNRVNLSMYKMANKAYYPTLSIVYSNSTQQNDNKFEPFEGGPQWYPARYWTLRASWDIFTGGTRWLQSKKSKVNYYESSLQLENAQKQSAINDENLRLAYNKAKAFMGTTERIMNLSFDNYQHISYKYEAGMAALEDRLNAFTDYITYQNQYLNSLSDMLIQLYQVKIRQQTF